MVEKNGHISAIYLIIYEGRLCLKDLQCFFFPQGEASKVNWQQIPTLGDQFLKNIFQGCRGYSQREEFVPKGSNSPL